MLSKLYTPSPQPAELRDWPAAFWPLRNSGVKTIQYCKYLQLRTFEALKLAVHALFLPFLEDSALVSEVRLARLRRFLLAAHLAVLGHVRLGHELGACGALALRRGAALRCIKFYDCYSRFALSWLDDIIGQY
jgi:hypothetical protein